MSRRTSFWLTVVMAALAAVVSADRSRAQCGTEVTGRFGGETGAVAMLNLQVIMIGRGSGVELLDLTNPNAPARFNPPRVIGLPAPATKIAATLHNDRVFVLMENGDVAVVTVTYHPSENTVRFAASPTPPPVIFAGDAVDLLAHDDWVYVVTLDEDFDDDEISSYVDVYQVDAAGNPILRDWVRPFLNNYGFDRIARIGNTIWLGMHELESSLLGVESYDVTDPTNLVRISTSLSNATLGTYTRVTGLQPIGDRLVLSYRNLAGTFSTEDWMRVVSVGSPSSPAWNPGVDLNGDVTTMFAVGNHLRVAIKDSGVGTWDLTSSASPVWLGAYFDTFPQIGQIYTIGGNDYWAAGRAGLMTVNTSNPAAKSLRTTLTNHPIGPSVIKQSGNTSVVLDYTLNTLRLFDYTLPEPQQLRSSVFLPLYARFLEMGLGAAGAQTLACVATDRPDSADSITVYDITNPVAPFVRATIPNIEVHLMSVVNSRMYVMTRSREFRIYELSQNPPLLRSTTPFGGNWYDYTCLLGWEAGAAKGVALGTDPFGLWVINVTDATLPLVSSIWNPATNYRVSALAKGNNNFLYVSSWIEGATSGAVVENRLETLNVSNLASVSQRFVHRPGSGLGSVPRFEHLKFVAAPSGKFLIGTRDDGWNGEIGAYLQVFELPPGFFTGEGVPFLLSTHVLPYVTGPAATNGNGSLFTLAAGAAGLYQLNTPVQWAPGYGIQSFDQTGCHAGSATFLAFPSGNPTSVTLQWYRYGPSDPNSSSSSTWVHTPLVNGPTGWGSTYSGATEVGLTISNIRGNDAKFFYYLAATNSCGTTNSRYAILDFCPADFNCSGSVTVQDLFDFLGAYFASDPRADFNASGSNTVQDLFDFLGAYFGFCY